MQDELNPLSGSSRMVTRRQAIGISFSTLVATALRGAGATPVQSRLAAEGAFVPGTSTPLLYGSGVTLQGPMGAAYAQSVARLGLPPYTLKWLRSDISFEQEREFTNFSGDVSGRFLEIASLTSDPNRPRPETLPALLDTVKNYQKADGHFGGDVDWTNTSAVMSKGTPILWGNARMLVGLTTAYERFGNPDILAAARKLGGFYLATADILCDPKRQAELHSSTGYASGFDTCYFPAIESLARLYFMTKDERYLQHAERMALLFNEWDHLPLPHTHGNLCAQYGLLLLYEATGNTAYLTHVEARWNEVVKGGYVCPTGGVGEKFSPDSERDEGCAESDWLRVTLRLWALTGRPEYLNMADREIHNEYLANRFPDGGFGHRFLESDPNGARALGKHSQEATWCCVFHGTLGLHFLTSYIAVGADDGIYLNFPLESSQTLITAGQTWKFSIAPHGTSVAGNYSVAVHLAMAEASKTNTTHLHVRIPDWASSILVTDANGREIKTKAVNEHLMSVGPLSSSSDLIISFEKRLAVEDRGFKSIQLATGAVTHLHDVVLRDGPHVLFANDAPASALLLVRVGRDGKIRLDPQAPGCFSAVSLPPSMQTGPDALAAEPSAPRTILGRFASLPESDRKLFVFDLLVVPA